MAKNNFNTTPKNKNPEGFKTRKGASNKTGTTPGIKEKRPVDVKKRNGIIITAVAAVLIVAVVAGITALIVAGILKGDKVDYLKDNLSPYIKLSRDEYTGIEIDVPLSEYDDIMLEREIKRLLVKHKSKDAEMNGLGITSSPITLGDIISYRYRVYTFDENGKEVEIPGYCNFNDENAATLEIGSQKSAFLGLEDAVIGVVPKDNPSFNAIKSGTVSAGDVIYFSYTAFYPSGAANSASYERIDLSREDIDSTYGEGFKNYIISSPIGEKLNSATFKGADGTIGYSDMKVEFVTQCEKSCLTYDIEFAVDHDDGTEIGHELRGSFAKIDVYIDSAIKYTAPEYNADFITKTLGLTEAELASYNGADIVEKHRSYLKAEITRSIQKTNEKVVSEAIWDKISTKGEIIKYPKGQYDELVNAYHSSVESYFNQNAESQGYPSIDSAAIDYFDLSAGADWEAHVKTLVENEIKEDILLYYIIRKEGMLPTDAEYEAEYNALLQEWVDIYLERHADEFANFTGAEYDEQLKILTNEVNGVYGEMIKRSVYMNVLLRKMQNDTKYVTVK